MDSLVLLRNMGKGAINECYRTLYQQLTLAHESLGMAIIPRYAGAKGEGSLFFDGITFKRPKKPPLNVDPVSSVRGIEITGSGYYMALVKDALEEINFTPSGRRLLQSLLQKKVIIQPPSMADVVRIAEGKFLASNKAGGNVVTFDPENHLLGADETLAYAHPWLRRDAIIGLYHELLHCYFHFHPQTIYDETRSVKLSITGAGTIEDEARITGTRLLKDGVMFDFHDPHYLARIYRDSELFTENHFRAEFADLRGQGGYYIRPHYGDGRNQLTIEKSYIKLAQVVIAH